MAKARTVFRCTECAGVAPQWAGRCPSCDAWNTLVEERDGGLGVAGSRLRTGATLALAPATAAVPITEVDLSSWHARSTGVGELDRVLSGGLVPGSVTLLGGEPGVGKSTLLLQMLGAMATNGARCLYVTAEESAQQVRLRGERLGALVPELYLASATSLPEIIGHVDALTPDIVAVDSIQTVFDPELSSAPGSVAQVRECAARLVHEAKARGCAVVLVGHVTKDGSLAGPRVLEHVVDTVLAFEGDRHHALRLLRAVKHRFGATDELGLFAMASSGLEPVADPSALFLADRRKGVAGSVVVPTLEGHRPLLVEVQALVAPSPLPTPRRSAQGVDGGRLALLLAVLDRRADVKVATSDVYALAVGGARVVEPAADLGLAIAVASSVSGVAVPDDLVVLGEVGLGGEVRQVAQADRRLAEAVRLGFTRAVVPGLTPSRDGVELLRVSTLAETINQLGVRPRSQPS
jgi:DNA repair protein RadA/Sms